MIQLMAHKMLRAMIADLLPQRWLSLLADGTRDVSNRAHSAVGV